MGDNALLERVLNGDETAFVEIVRRYNSTLVRVACTYVANDATAEDVAPGDLDGRRARDRAI